MHVTDVCTMIFILIGDAPGVKAVAGTDYVTTSQSHTFTSNSSNNFSTSVQLYDNKGYKENRQFAVVISLDENADNPRVNLSVSRILITIIEDDRMYI